VFAAIVIHHAVRLRRTIMSSVSCLILQYFSTLFHQRYEFRRKTNFLKCVFWLHWDIIMNIYRSSYNAPAILYIYILRSFKTSDYAFRLPHSIACDCSIHPFLDLFHSWLYIFHLPRFFGDGLVFSRYYRILINRQFSRQIFANSPNMQFLEYSSSESPVVPCRQTYRRKNR
jgi:hypothetical protein